MIVRPVLNMRSCARALTLVELLAALAILSVFVGAVASWASGAARLSASAARETESATALSNVAGLLRRDLAERPVDSTSTTTRGGPTLPYEILVNPDAGSITLVTASHAPAATAGEAKDTSGAGGSGGGAGADSGGGGGSGGWWTVAWRYDASRGELLRGSWPFERGHADSPPIALHDDTDTRVALRGLGANRGFELRRVEATIADAGLVDAGPAPAPIAVWVAEITLESGEQASVVLGRAAANTPGGPR